MYTETISIFKKSVKRVYAFSFYYGGKQLGSRRAIVCYSIDCCSGFEDEHNVMWLGCEGFFLSALFLAMLAFPAGPYGSGKPAMLVGNMVIFGGWCKNLNEVLIKIVVIEILETKIQN